MFSAVAVVYGWTFSNYNQTLKDVGLPSIFTLYLTEQNNTEVVVEDGPLT